MKKVISIWAVLIGLFASINALARDDSHLQDITNWTPFFTEGKTFSYEHEEGAPFIPKVYEVDDEIGYLYYYVKHVPNEENRDEFDKLVKKFDSIKFENVKPAYMICWERMDCKNETTELKQIYFYSDKNMLIVSYTFSNHQGKPLKGTHFERIPFDTYLISRAKKEAEQKDKNEALKIKLQKYGAEALVPINQLEVNPYEFEGHVIAVVVQFKKMLSKSSASFYSGYANLEDTTNVYDEIIVTGIPKGKHFEAGPYACRMMLVLKGKGSITGTNAFGAKIKAPYFQWIDIISGEQPSVFEEQRSISTHNALQNLQNMRNTRHAQ